MPRPESRSVHTFETITLKVYLEVARTGDVSLLGEGAIIDDWEDILDKAGEHGEDDTFVFNIKKESQINRFKIQYRIVDVMLNMILPYEANEDCINFLKNKGILIDTSSKRAYRRSIERGNSKKESWLAKIESLKLQLKSDADFEEKVSFYDIIAGLHDHGFQCGEDLKLVLYFSYKKRIKEKLDAYNKRHRRSQPEG